MRCAGDRWSRAAAAVLVLLGTLLLAGPGAGPWPGYEAGGAAPRAVGAVHAVPAVPAVPAVRGRDAAGAPGRPPGCDPFDDRGGLTPAVPPRPGPRGEPLSAPHVARAADGAAWDAAAAVPDVRPERGPPPLAPPSPQDLSILRV